MNITTGQPSTPNNNPICEGPQFDSETSTPAMHAFAAMMGVTLVWILGCCSCAIYRKNTRACKSACKSACKTVTRRGDHRGVKRADGGRTLLPTDKQIITFLVYQIHAFKKLSDGYEENNERDGLFNGTIKDMPNNAPQENWRVRLLYDRQLKTLQYLIYSVAKQVHLANGLDPRVTEQAQRVLAEDWQTHRPDVSFNKLATILGEAIIALERALPNKTRRPLRAQPILDENDRRVRRCVLIFGVLRDPNDLGNRTLGEVIAQDGRDLIQITQRLDNLDAEAIAAVNPTVALIRQAPFGLQVWDEGDLPKGEGEDNNECWLWCTRWFPIFSSYPIPFIIYWVLVLAIFISWLAKINQENKTMDPAILGHGGMGVTFFNIPPQYNVAANPRQGVAVPFIYAFMHSALFTLGVLPVTMMRGLMWRFLPTLVIPGCGQRCPPQRLSDYIPFEHLRELHIYLGFLLLFFLACGATTWMATMYVDCAANVTNACAAFNPNVNCFYNPLENVLMLRFLIWPSWFFFLPLMYWADKPMSFLLRPRGLRWISQMYYEILYSLHLVFAYVVVLLAFIARFDIFWPVLISWGIYVFDMIFEYTYRCGDRKAYIQVEQSKLFYKSVKEEWVGYQASLLTLHLETSDYWFNNAKAGQFIFLHVPSVNCMTSHPFTIRSVEQTRDGEKTTLTLHVGVREVSTSKKQRYSSKYRNNKGRSEMLHPSWTYSLFEKVRLARAGGVPTLKAYLRGPYGSTYQAVFDERFHGVLAIAAGTGLPAIEHVLQRFLEVQNNPRSTQDANADQPLRRLWVVWQCTKIQQLEWCFVALIDRLVTALWEYRRIRDLDTDYIMSTNKPFDWLTISIFVTGETEDDLEITRRLLRNVDLSDQGERADGQSLSPSEREDKRKLFDAVKRWLVDQIKPLSPRSKVLPKYQRYIRGARLQLHHTLYAEPKLAVNYCGNKPVGDVVAKAVARARRELSPGEEIFFAKDSAS